jgi:glycosyltransferase involved in cell wall biosynthesis
MQNSVTNPAVPKASKVSIVIAARNAERTLAKCLDSLMKLDYPDYEVIVVDDGSSDWTAEIAASYQKFKVLRTAGLGRSTARNLGVKEARGDFIAFTDSDCIVHPEWLTELLSVFASDDITAVGGIQRSPGDETWFGKKVHRFLGACGFFTSYMQSFPDVREVTHNASCNVMYRKSAYEAAGGFSAKFVAGEDPDLDYRLRQKEHRLFFNPKAIVYHYRAKTLAQFGRMMCRYGAAQGELVRAHGVYRPVQWLPILSMIGLVLLTAGFVIHPGFTWIALFFIAGTVLGWLSFDLALVGLGIVAFFAWHSGFIRTLFSKKERGLLRS